MASVNSATAARMVVGREIPDVELVVWDRGKNARTTVKVLDITHDKTVWFTVPGAFTPTCSGTHFPSFITEEGKLYDLGYTVFCLSRDTIDTLEKWKATFTGSSPAAENITMVSDPYGHFGTAAGLLFDHPHLGRVYKRTSFAVDEEGLLKVLNIEEAAKECGISSGPKMVDALTNPQVTKKAREEEQPGQSYVT